MAHGCMVELNELVSVVTFVDAVCEKIRHLYIFCDVVIIVWYDVIPTIAEEGYAPHVRA